MFVPAAISKGQMLLCPLFLLALAAPLAAGGASDARVLFSDSIVGIPAGASGSRPHVVRGALSAQEFAAPLYFTISLRMRNFPELEDRIGHGQIVSHGEMEARYLPDAADFERVTSWLENQGFVISLKDRNHTNVFARGSVGRISSALGATFARVATAEGEFTSAISPPGLPSSLSSAVLCIDGLQPHIRAPRPHRGASPAGGLGTISGAPTPADIANAYNLPAGLSGAGQTIAIIANGAPSLSDVSAFWSACGINQSLGNISVENINGGAPAGADLVETTLDVEWASSIAPGSRIRLYNIPDYQYSSVVAAATQVFFGLPEDPGLQQLSISITGPEDEAGSRSILESYSQTYAQLAAAGVTVLVCSGDGGSNPDPDNSPGYGASYPLSVSYPACDSNVTAVGGTTLAFSANGLSSGETSWYEVDPPGSSATVASGGGLSKIFARPSWQTGVGVPSTSSRCVPDVAVQADAGFLLINGQNNTCWGTSLATPIWGGITAIMNQARSYAGIPAIGLLSTRVYPLIGTSAFNDITSGSNGAYNAGAGYDLCTGVGSPNVANLISLMDGVPSSPSGARLINISTRAMVGTGGSILIPGFVVSGSGTETLLIRGDGPSLAQFNVPGVLAQPSLSVYDSNQNLIASNTGWGANANPAQVASVAAQVGAFAFTSGSADCALIASLPAGAYTVQISGVGNTTGVALAEIYEVSTTGTRLANISTRAQVGTGGNILIPGFVISGSGSEQLLVRGDGPSLSQFNVPGVLAQPALGVYNSAQALIASNTAWGTAENSGQIANIAATVGAFAFSSGSADSAQVVDLPAGAYTIQVSGVNDTTGVALAEVYEVPQ
jgi:kumamolisin